ncbi:hypothetical protein ACIQNG_26100 [Streptomyces sp. NPDC091377]|uniref:hypothetical protein n=1 Tax=Streptomyces sp. NPDC091377 TaxID=3365995 RepID=UPI00381BA0AA
MRLAREHKYWGAVQVRAAALSAGSAGRAEGWTAAGESFTGPLAWAPHAPTDRAAVLDEVVKAYGAAVKMLVEAGYPIEEVSLEVERIAAEAYPGLGAIRQRGEVQEF